MGGRTNGVCGIWSHRSSFSFLISWALSLQSDEGGKEEGLGQGGGGRDDREFGELGLVTAACLRKQGPLQSAAHPPYPASSSLMQPGLLILNAPNPGPGVNWRLLH